MSGIRRINFYGGPGIGKSTTAAGVFSGLKRLIFAENLEPTVELVTEYVKDWAWDGIPPREEDQTFIFANQQRKEIVPLRGGADVVVSDSPLLLNVAYAFRDDLPVRNALLDLWDLHEDKYPSINIFLDRGNRPYNPKGRFQTRAQAVEMDQFILKFMESNLNGNFVTFDYEDWDGIFAYCIQKLNLERWYPPAMKEVLDDE